MDAKMTAILEIIENIKNISMDMSTAFISGAVIFLVV